jgi:type IV pilus assembly protein PilO
MAAPKKPGGAAGLENLSLPGRIAVGLVFVLMVGAAYFVVFYGEIDGNIAAQIQLKSTKERELATSRDADDEYNKDLTELERRKQIAVKQKKILPDDAEWAPFLATLQNAATLSGIDFANWEPQDEVPESFYVKVPMKVKLKGRYHQIAKFFHSIGQADRIINMADIRMTTGKGQQDTRRTQAKPGQADAAISEGEETVLIEVEALATAFRAMRAGETAGGGKDAGGRRPRNRAKPAPAPAPAPAKPAAPKKGESEQ